MLISEQMQLFETLFDDCAERLPESFKEVREKCMSLLNEKRDAYASAARAAEDALENFKRNAARLDLTVFQIWAVYFNKHVDSVNNAIAKNPVLPVDGSEGMRSRFMDIINYAGLGFCLLAETEQMVAELTAAAATTGELT